MRLNDGVAALMLLSSLQSGCKFFEARKSTPARSPNATTSQTITGKRGFLTEAELMPPDRIVQLQGDQIPKEMNAQGAVVMAQSNFVPPTTTGQCWASVMTNSIVRATASELNIDYQLADATACLAPDVNRTDAATGVSVQIKNGSIHLMLLAGCEGEDISSYHGKTLKEILEQKLFNTFCQKGQKSYSLTNFDVKMSLVYSVKGVTINMDTRAVSFHGQNDGGPCVVNNSGDTWNSNGCRDVQLNSVSKLDASTTMPAGFEALANGTYKVIESKNLVGGNKSGAYFSSGAISIVLSNWQGEFVFSDANTPPRWNMSKTGSDETRTGVFGQTKLNNAPETDRPLGYQPRF